MTQEEVMQTVAEKFRLMLAPDGVSLTVHLVSDDSVQIILTADADTCADCLVPDEVLVAIISDSIREQGGTVGVIELVKKGFDGV